MDGFTGFDAALTGEHEIRIFHSVFPCFGAQYVVPGDEKTETKA